MRCLRAAVVIGSQRSGADEDVAYADLAAAVGLTVVAGEAFDENAGKFIFAVEVDVFVRNEYVVEDNESFRAAEFGVARIHFSAFELTRIAGLTADDHENAFGVGRAGEGNSVVFVVFAHGDRRHDDNFMGVDEARLMSFCAADDDAVGAAFYDVEVQIGIFLCVGSQAAVALRVGHGAVNCKVLRLHPFHEGHEVVMIVSAVFLVDIIRRGEYGVESVHAYAALEAGSRFLAEETLHFYFVHQVSRALMNVRKAVYPFACIRRHNGHQILVFRHLSQVIGHADGIQRRTENRVVYRTFYFFAKHVYLQVQFSHAFNILFASH